MNLKQIEERLSEIKVELRTDGADIDALTIETDGLLEQRKNILDNAEKRDAILERISKGNGVVVKEFEVKNEERKLDENSKEYRSAFAKKMLGQKLNEVEERAYLHTTENTGAVIPKELLNKIYSTMEEKHPILADIQTLRTGTIISIAKHTEIKAGDAKVVAEGAAATDENNTFVEVTLSGKDFKKKIKFSARLGKMAIPAFETYLTNELSARIGSAMANDVISQIERDLAASNKISTKGKGKVDVVDITTALSKLKSVGNVNVYCNSATFYGLIANMEGAKEKLTFINNLQENISGAILGKAIKEEDAIADNKILILDPQQYIQNVVQDITVKKMEDEDFNNILTGMAIAGGTLTNDKAGTLITVSATA